MTHVNIDITYLTSPDAHFNNHCLLVMIEVFLNENSKPRNNYLKINYKMISKIYANVSFQRMLGLVGILCNNTVKDSQDDAVDTLLDGSECCAHVVDAVGEGKKQRIFLLSLIMKQQIAESRKRMFKLYFHSVLQCCIIWLKE